MPSPFVTLAREAQSHAFDHHGEMFTHFPMMPAPDKTRAALPDPDRASRVLPGIYFEKDARALIPNGYDPRTDQRPGTKSDHPRIEFPATLAVDGFVARHGDRFERASNGRAYHVSAVHVKKTGVVVCEVNSLG